VVSVLALSADVVGLFLSPANASELARLAMIAKVESFLVITKLLYSVVGFLTCFTDLNQKLPRLFPFVGARHEAGFPQIEANRSRLGVRDVRGESLCGG